MKSSHKGINPMHMGHGGKEYAVVVGQHMGRSAPVPAGQSAKSSMMDGPFGGKKPE